MKKSKWTQFREGWALHPSHAAESAGPLPQAEGLCWARRLCSAFTRCMGGGRWCEGSELGGAPNAEPVLPQGCCALRGDGRKWGWGWRTESSGGGGAKGRRRFRWALTRTRSGSSVFRTQALLPSRYYRSMKMRVLPEPCRDPSNGCSPTLGSSINPRGTLAGRLTVPSLRSSSGTRGCKMN